jgi:hypothetical protein
MTSFILSLQQLLTMYPALLCQVNDYSFLIKDFEEFKGLFDRGDAPFERKNKIKFVKSFCVLQIDSNYASFTRQLNKYGFCYQNVKLKNNNCHQSTHKPNTRYYVQLQSISISDVNGLNEYRRQTDPRLLLRK